MALPVALSRTANGRQVPFACATSRWSMKPAIRSGAGMAVYHSFHNSPSRTASTRSFAWLRASGARLAREPCSRRGSTQAIRVLRISRRECARADDTTTGLPEAAARFAIVQSSPPCVGTGSPSSRCRDGVPRLPADPCSIQVALRLIRKLGGAKAQVAAAIAPGPGIALGGHLPRMIMPRTSSLVTSRTRAVPTTRPFFMAQMRSARSKTS